MGFHLHHPSFLDLLPHHNTHHPCINLMPFFTVAFTAKLSEESCSLSLEQKPYLATMKVA
jgi:hypothetical protein